MKYHNIDGFDFEINAVPCSDLNVGSLLRINDINATAAYFEVTNSDDVINILMHCAPSFWWFLSVKEHTIR